MIIEKKHDTEINTIPVVVLVKNKQEWKYANKNKFKVNFKKNKNLITELSIAKLLY